MNKTEIIKNFNSILSNFLQQVSPLVGPKYHSKFNLLIRVNAILPIQRFSEFGLKHKTKIMEKDPDYFLNENTYKSDVEQHYGDESEEYLNEILQLKDVYLGVDDDSKENIWSILQALLLLAEEYMKL